MSFHFNRNGILDTSLRCHLFSRRFPVRVSARIRSDHTENKSSRPRRQISRPDKCCKFSQKQKKRAHKEMEDADGRAHWFSCLRPLPLPRSHTKRRACPPCLYVEKDRGLCSLFSGASLLSNMARHSKKGGSIAPCPPRIGEGQKNRRSCPRDRRNYSLQNPVLRAAKMSRTMHPP